MKKTAFVFSLLCITAILVFAFRNSSKQQEKEPWRQDQLMNPADLARKLNDGIGKKPVIFSIGPAGTIKGAVDIGPSSETKNFDKLRQELGRLPKETNIVIYCGCCPFEHCPNIRPAFSLLNEMKFTNHKLLNLPHNLKADWIDKGYPMHM